MRSYISPLASLVAINIRITMFRDVPLLAIIFIHVMSDFTIFSLSLSNIVGRDYLFYLVTGLIISFAVSYSAVSIRPLAASKMVDRVLIYISSLPIPRIYVPLSFISSSILISLIASTIPLPLYYLYIYIFVPEAILSPATIALILIPLALVSLMVSSIMTMAAYLTDNFALYLTIGSLLITLMNFTSTIYYPPEAFAELLGWGVAGLIRYNPASLASDIARSVVSGVASLEPIAILSMESIASAMISLMIK